MKRIVLMAMVAGLAATVARAGRYEEFTKKAAQGPKAEVVAATYFGGPGIEGFVAVDSSEGGAIVAFGDAWGPQFPTQPAPTVLGKGAHRGLQPYQTDNKGRKTLDPRNPDIAGMIVIYDATLSRVVKVIRFDWGVASITAGKVTPDGRELIVAGRCTPAFRELARGAKTVPQPPVQETTDRRGRVRRVGPDAGPYEYEGVQCPGDVYVAKVTPAGEIRWAWILEGHRAAPEKLWTDNAGNVYVQVHGVKRISADGRTLTPLTDSGSGGRVGLRAVDPVDGSFYIGGDRNTSTGREPWRQPFLYKYDPKGEKVATLWEYPSRALRDGKGTEDGLVSDSAARHVAIMPNGDLMVGGWSDGGNSIFTRQPTDVEKPAPKPAFGMSCWGMKAANSLSYLMRIDPKTWEQKAWNLWVAYLPDNFEEARVRGAPNFASLDDVIALPDGSVGFLGRTATALVETPNAFYRMPTDGSKSGGPFAAIFDPTMTNLLFSSHLPGCEDPAIGPAPKGMAIVSRASGASDDGQKTPTVKAIRGEKQGDYDAHIVLLKLP